MLWCRYQVSAAGRSFTASVNSGELNVTVARIVTKWSLHGELRCGHTHHTCWFYTMNVEGRVFAYLSSFLWPSRIIHLPFYTHLLLSLQLTFIYHFFTWRCLVSIHKFCADLQIEVNYSVLTGFLVECSLQLICCSTLWMGRGFSRVSFQNWNSLLIILSRGAVVFQ